MNNEKVALFYDKLRENEWSKTADFGPSTRSRYQIIVKLINKYVLNKESSILDIGCGSGNMLKLLNKNKFSNISGCDFSTGAINLTLKKHAKNIFVANILNLSDFNNVKYDVIICSEVLEHIGDDSKAISNLYELLNNEGILIISVPYNMKYWSQHDEFAGHVRRYNSNEIEDKLIKQGFCINESFGWGSLIYSFYHAFLVKTTPSKLMGKNNMMLKKVFSKILRIGFNMEFLDKTKGSAKRIFVVAQKK